MTNTIKFNIWLMELNNHFQNQGYDFYDFPNHTFKDDFDLGYSPETAFRLMRAQHPTWF